jgi:RNA polymerase sigma-70 factor (ECF subfamily)
MSGSRVTTNVAHLSRHTDEQLLVLTSSDPEAFAVFYRRHVAELLRYFRARTSDAQLALDLAGETFARTLENASRFDAEREHARAWLFAIAHNLLVDSYRRGRVESDARRRLGIEPMVVTDTGLERVEAMLDAARRLTLSELQDELSPAQAEAITGRVVEERSYEQLAAELECSPQVVRQHVSRGLRILRRNRKVPA